MRLLFPTALAQEMKATSIFDTRLDPALAAMIRQRLGSTDIPSQMATRRLLIEAGPKAFAFIMDSLDVKHEYGVDRALLVHNLAVIVTADEQLGHRFSQAGHLKIPSACYDLGGYQAASQYFEKAGSAVTTANDYLMRGYTFEQSKQVQRAIADYQAAVDKADTPYVKAVSRTALGGVYQDAGWHHEAESEFNAALKLEPNYY